MIANFQRRQVYIGSAIVLALLILVIFVASNQKVGSTIYPHTYIDKIDMGGKTQAEARALLEKKYDYINNTTIKIIYKDQQVASFSAEQLRMERDIKEVVDHAYIIGRTPHAPSRILQQVVTFLNIRSYNFYSTIRYNKEPVQALVKEMTETYEKPAKDALFTFEEGKVTSFKAHEKGLKLKTEEFLIAFNSAVQEVKENKTNLKLAMTDTVIEPEITLSKANNLGIEELIGEGQSDYSHSIPGRVHNVQLAANKFHGVLIPKGEEFSFNKYIGDISAATGYQQAYIIQNGRTVLGDGGGVCQVSTTLFRAALNSGLPITDRTPHAYRVSYYENDGKPGLDATIFNPTVDFKFKNDTQASILIQMELEPDSNILRFKLYGTRDNRKVEISDVTVWDVVGPPEPKYEDDPNLPNGEVRQVDYPAWGSKAKFMYKVTKENGEMYEKEFYSSYRPWQAVFLRGTKT